MRRRISFSQRSQESEEIHINLTPLIDVVFVVLIIFMIIAPMLETDKVELAAAAAHINPKEMAHAQENSPIAIHVHGDNSVWFNQRRISFEELLPLLKDAKKRHPHKTPQLFHDKKASFGTYQTIKNTLELAGFEQLDIILTPG